MLSGKLTESQAAAFDEAIPGLVAAAAILSLKGAISPATFDDDVLAVSARITRRIGMGPPDTFEGYREWVVEICENALKLIKPMMAIPPNEEDEGHSDLSSPDSELRARADALNDERAENGE